MFSGLTNLKSEWQPNENHIQDDDDSYAEQDIGAIDK